MARYDFNADALFKDVDDININYVDAQNLKRFLIKSGVFANEQLLIAILRRFDLDADAKLNKKEFTEGITPSIQDFSKRQLKDKSITQSISSQSRVLSPSRNQRQTLRSSSKKTLNKSAVKESTTPRGKSSHKRQKSGIRSQKSASKTAQGELSNFSTLQNQRSAARINDENKSTLQSPHRE